MTSCLHENQFWWENATHTKVTNAGATGCIGQLEKKVQNAFLVEYKEDNCFVDNISEAKTPILNCNRVLSNYHRHVKKMLNQVRDGSRSSN